MSSFAGSTQGIVSPAEELRGTLGTETATRTQLEWERDGKKNTDIRRQHEWSQHQEKEMRKKKKCFTP